MSKLHKQDLAGLVGIALFAAVVGYFTTPQFGFMVWAGATATVTVTEWLSRRRQRQLLPRMEKAGEQALALAQLMQASSVPELVAQAKDHEKSARAMLASVSQARERLS